MRQKVIVTSLALVCCLALAVAAQFPTGRGKDVNLTGCLQAGMEPNTFILKNVSTQAAAGSETRPAELAKADAEYRLTADATVNLKDHVGHKVEVSGIITGQTQERSAASEAARMSQFKVKSIKQVSETCP